MPCGDHTGPEGLGPASGRRMGYCAGYEQAGAMSAPGYGGRKAGLGMRRGRGFGREVGRGVGPGPFDRRFAPRYHGQQWPMAPENRRALLQEEIEVIDRKMEELAKEREFLQKERDVAEGDS